MLNIGGGKQLKCWSSNSGRYLQESGGDLPADIALRYSQLNEWNIPEDAWHYLLGKNLVELIERIGNELGFNHREVGILIGHRFRHLQGRGLLAEGFSYERLYDLFVFLNKEKLLPPVARLMLPAVVATAEPDFKKILAETGYKKVSLEEIKSEVKGLGLKYREVCYKSNGSVSVNWVMGQLHMKAIGNVRLARVREEVADILDVRY